MANKTKKIKSPKTVKTKIKSPKKSKKPINYNFIPFLLFALAVFIETCLIFNTSTGIAGSFIHNIFLGVFGASAFLIPCCILFIAFYFFGIRKNKSMIFKSVLALLFCLNFTTAHALIADVTEKFTFAGAYNRGISGISGGVTGELISKLFALLFGKTLGTVICILICIVIISFFFGTNMSGLWHPLVEKLKEKRIKKAREQEEKGENIAIFKENPPDFQKEEQKPQTDIYPAPKEKEETYTFHPFAYGNIFINDKPKNQTKDIDLDNQNQSEYANYPPKTPENPMTAGYKRVSEQHKSKGMAYSPFANPFVSPEDIFGNKEAKHVQQIQKHDETNKFSPFSNPIAFKEHADLYHESENPAPQSYIACGISKENRENKEKSDSVPKNSISFFEKPANSERSSGVYRIKELPKVTENKQQTEDFTPFATQNNHFAAGSYGKEENSSANENTGTCGFADNPYSQNVNSSHENDGSDENKSEKDDFISNHVTPNEDFNQNENDFPFDTDDDEEEDDTNLEDAEEFVKPPKQAETTVGGVQQKFKNSYPEEFSVHNESEINLPPKKRGERYPNYVLPPFDLLTPKSAPPAITEEEVSEIENKILGKLASFNIKASLSGYSIGPTITRYELIPGPGVKVKQITSLIEDLSLELQSDGIRIATVPGKSVIGIEVPNEHVSTVHLRGLLENKEFLGAKSKITVCIGLTVTGKPVYMDIDDMPHVLIAGETKSGKSVAINCMILSLLYRCTPDEVQLILVDPKRVELNIYSKLPHLIMPVIDEPKRAAAALQWAVNEMERRYQILTDVGARNREEYYEMRKTNPNLEYMPQIIIIIDELADLMLQMRDPVENLINRLAALARACGMHLVVGTQRPSVDIVTGLIKANIPARVSFKVSSPQDSRIILGGIGAEKLLGRGDMLYQATGSGRVRVQGAFVTGSEIKKVLQFINDKNGVALFDSEIMHQLDDEYDKVNKTKNDDEDDEENGTVDGYHPDFETLCRAIEFVIETGKTTTNSIQRQLRIGFNRAADLVDAMEDLKFISAKDGSKPREVLVDWDMYEQWKLNNQN